jgi:hypothetical protein
MTFKSVFIGGLDRSGKTYMRFILESHPEIVFSKRTSLWPKYYQKFGALEVEENLEMLLNALSKNKHVMALSPDFQRLKVDYIKGPRIYERLFELIHQQYVELNGSKYWGDQTEFLESYASIILHAYPHAKFVHMIRDPRDRFAAILNKSKKRQGLGIATARWLISANLAHKNQSTFPERYLVMRYETLVSDPEKTTKNVCDFLGIQYYPSMLRLDQIPRFKNQIKDGNQTYSPITNQYVGQFKKQLTQSQILFIEKFSRKYLNEYQYQLNDSQHVSRLASYEYLKTWPINFLQMFGWKLITKEGRV